MSKRRNHNPMEIRPVMPLLLSMSVPPMVSMLVQSLYNVVDSMFVASISEKALTAVSLAYPLQNVVLAVAVGLGVGLNSCIARSLGAGNRRQANLEAAHGLLFALAHSLLFVLAGLFAVKPFMGMFTGDPQIYRMGCEYASIVVALSFGSIIHIYVEKMFQATGNMVVPMVMQMVGALVNIVLDPILIFGWMGIPSMGVKGAAVATVTGQMTACILAVLLFIRRDHGIRIPLSGFRFQWRIMKNIYSVAVPSAIMTSITSLLVSVLNAMVISVSQTAVALLGIYIKLQSFVYMPANGVIQGMRPIVSFNYGAEQYERTNRVIRCSLLFTGSILLIGTALLWIWPGEILCLFDAGAGMLELGVPALRILSGGFVVSAVGIVFCGVFEALGKGMYSLAISLVRQMAVIPPLSWVLMQYLGLNGVWISFPVAECLAAVVALRLFQKNWKTEKTVTMF